MLALPGPWELQRDLGNLLTNPGPFPSCRFETLQGNNPAKRWEAAATLEWFCVLGREKELGCSCRKGKGRFTAEHEVKLGLCQSEIILSLLWLYSSEQLC